MNMNRIHFICVAAAVLAGALAGCTPVQSDDEYSIRLMVVVSPDHVQRVQTYKERTEQETGWTGLYVLVKADFSELYWGKYPSKEAAEGDLRRAKSFRTHVGIQAFPIAAIVPIPGTDIGPPEMNLANAKGVYTVLIATFHDVPERRQYAVDNCKDLRQKGEEAYFYHTSTQSIVTIGAFDASAVKEVRNGAATTTEVNSEGVLQILRNHPLLAENGYSVKVVVPDILSHKAVKVDKHSYVIRIPRDTDNELPAYPSEVKPATLPGNP
jgi:hypothetical protein